mgnify:CR=1 FL=1
MTVQCCVCKKVKIDDSWMNTGNEHRRDVSHTYCPTCLRTEATSMAAERRQANMANPVTA